MKKTKNYMTKHMMNGQDFKPKQFSDSQLMRALYDVDDILGRALCPYILLKDTAKSLKEGMVLSGNGIYIGIERRFLTKEVMSTIKVYLKDRELRDNGFSYVWDGVPVSVQFIENTYKFFERPDYKFYMASEYKIPNPFDTYWKVRGVIK